MNAISTTAAPESPLDEEPCPMYLLIHEAEPLEGGSLDSSDGRRLDEASAPAQSLVVLKLQLLPELRSPALGT